MKFKLIIKVALVLLVLTFILQITQWFLIPNQLKPDSTKQNYIKQWDRLEEIAQDYKTTWNSSVEVCDADLILFEDPNILRASVQPIDGTNYIIGNKSFQARSSQSIAGSSWFSDLSPHLEWHTLSDDSKLSTVSYSKTIIDKHGDEVIINLTLANNN
jgi:hypothetical protein